MLFLVRRNNLSKYIKVKIELEKTIKVEKDKLEDAIDEVNNLLPELETTSEWLNCRNVEMKENTIVNDSAKYISMLFSKQVGKEHYKKDVRDFVDIALNNDIADYVYEETINILKKDYNMNFVDKINKGELNV